MKGTVAALQYIIVVRYYLEWMMHFPWEISRSSPKEAQRYFMGSSNKPFDENALIMYGKGSDRGGDQKGQGSPNLWINENKCVQIQSRVASGPI